MKGTIKHYFPGGNTSKGFYSFYRYIMSQNAATRIFCIKGGPGTGKSSFMKKIGKYYNEKGYDIEFHHCSSDNNSLDGVVIKDLKVVFLDGTAPHVVDPINPGAVDEIINLGEYWNQDGFTSSRNNIININKEVGKHFKRAYKYIAASKLIYDDWCNYYNEALDYSKLNILSEDLKQKIFKTEVNHTGIDRHLFATAFTPNGVITFINNLCEGYENIYVLNGPPTIGKHKILEYIMNEGLKRGHYIEALHTPLVPGKLEHILIPELSVAIITSNEINVQHFNGYQIELAKILNYQYINKYQDNINESKETFYNLLSKGISNISQAKKLHDELEKFYIPNMKFDEIDILYDNILDRLSKY